MAKIRTGFVSNSSSSSFILDLRDEESKQFVEFLKKYFDLREAEINIYIGKRVLDNYDWIQEDIENGDDEHEDFNKVKSIPPEFLVEIDMDNSIAWKMKIPNVVYGD